MKKIISICIMCLFFAVSANATSAKSLVKNPEFKKVTYSLKQFNAVNIEVASLQTFNDLPWRFCYVSGVTVTGSGYDMNNVYWETYLITITCIEA